MIAAALTLLVWSTLTIAAPAGWGTGSFEAGCLVLGLTWNAFAAWRGHSALAGFPTALLAATVVCGLLQLTLRITVYRYATTLGILHWTALLMVVFVSRQAFKDARQLDLFRNVLAIFAGMASLYVLVQPYLGPEHLAGLIRARTEDMAGPFQNRNTYASFIELALPVAVWKALCDRERSWIWWTSVGVMAASVVSAASRAGSILVALELVVIVLVVRCKRLVPTRKLVLAVAQIAVLAAVWVVLGGWERLWQRLWFDNPLAYRREIVASAVAMISSRPWTGFGLGAFVTSYPRFAAFDAGKLVNFVHNDWLQWGAEGGVILLAAMLLLAGWCFRHAWKHVWSIGLLFVFVHALVDFPMQRSGLGGWIFVMVAGLESVEASEVRSPAAFSSHLRSAPSLVN